MGWVGFFEEFHDNVGFIERFGLAIGAGGVREGRYQPAGVKIDEALGLVVRIHFDILVGDVLLFKNKPHALDWVRSA